MEGRVRVGCGLGLLYEAEVSLGGCLHITLQAAPHLERADERHARRDRAAHRPLLVCHCQVDDHPPNQACRWDVKHSGQWMWLLGHGWWVE